MFQKFFTEIEKHGFDVDAWRELVSLFPPNYLAFLEGEDVELTIRVFSSSHDFSSEDQNILRLQIQLYGLLRYDEAEFAEAISNDFGMTGENATLLASAIIQSLGSDFRNARITLGTQFGALE